MGIRTLDIVTVVEELEGSPEVKDEKITVLEFEREQAMLQVRAEGRVKSAGIVMLR